MGVTAHQGRPFQKTGPDALNVGAVYGIELLNANAQLQGAEGASLVVWNEQLQLRKQISLSEA
jgi:hypothetical protein